MPFLHTCSNIACDGWSQLLTVGNDKSIVKFSLMKTSSKRKGCMPFVCVSLQESTGASKVGRHTDNPAVAGAQHPSFQDGSKNGNFC